MNRNDLGLIYGKDVVDGLEQVGLPPEHGGAFGEGARPAITGSLKWRVRALR